MSLSDLASRTIAALLLATGLLAQTETRSTVSGAAYPVEWSSGPSRDSVPEWAKPGRIRFTRWDGGPIETAKAFLSGWPGFNPPIPAYLDTMTNWYDPKTISLLREAAFNTIWVTFSNGFSIPTESVQREKLRRYIDGCHRQGIRVFAYQSVGNMFWEDMYEHVPESRNWIQTRDGKPQAYGAGMYEKMGRVTRYMADLSQPGWHDYLKRRIDLAIDAGADGIMYDNCFHPAMGEVFAEIQRYANSRKPDMLIMANFHNGDFIFNRLINAITTEEGGEAGIFTEANVLSGRWKPFRPYMLNAGDGLLANNIGRFKIFENLSEGWKPVMLESRLREAGQAETHVMSAERQQLVLAENMMFSMANETFVEGKFAYGLWTRDPETIRIWRAIGTYNRFFADNQQYYGGTRSLASLAIVLDNRSESVPLLSGLAGRRVNYDVLYEHELTPARLKPYAAVALLTAVTVRDRAIKALEAYSGNGGRLIVAGKAATLDEKGQSRPQPGFLRNGSPKTVYFENLPPVAELTRTLLAADREPPVKLDAPSSVLYNFVEQPESGRRILHLLNYSPRPVDAFRVVVRGRYGRAQLFTPDAPRPLVQATVGPQSVTVKMPIKTYTILVLDKQETAR